MCSGIAHLGMFFGYCFWGAFVFTEYGYGCLDQRVNTWITRNDDDKALGQGK